MNRHDENVRIYEEEGVNALLLANIGLTRTVARKHALHRQRWDLIEDYDSAAAMGFLVAFTNGRVWDHEKVALGSFVGIWMLNSMTMDVDKHQGSYGISPSNSILSGQRDPDHMPVVASLDFEFEWSDDNLTLADRVPDPSAELAFERVDDRLEAESNLALAMSHLDSDEQRMLTDWMPLVGEDRWASMLAKKWGMSDQSVYNKVSAIEDKLRKFLPHLVVGDRGYGTSASHHFGPR